MATDWSSIFNTAGTVASVIPGGQPFAAALGGIGSLIGLGGANKRKSNAEKMNEQVLQMQMEQMKQQLAMSKISQPIWQDEISKLASGSPYAAAGPYDQYSPAWNEAATGAFRDDTAQRLQGELSAADYYLRPQGGIRSSAMEYAKAKALRDSNSENAAFQRNLRIQGGVERYNNMQKSSDERYRRLMSLMGMGMGGGMNNQPFQQNANAAGVDYNNQVNSLSGAAAAIAKAGGFGQRGPQGGQVNQNRGNATLSPWNQNQSAQGAPNWGDLAQDPAMYMKNLMGWQ